MIYDYIIFSQILTVWRINWAGSMASRRSCLPLTANSLVKNPNTVGFRDIGDITLQAGISAMTVSIIALPLSITSAMPSDH